MAVALQVLDAAPTRIAAEAWPGDLHDLDCAGLYSWWADTAGATALSEGLGYEVGAGRIYAGQAGATKWPSGKTSSQTLRSRIGSSHLRGRIRGSTFRLTMAAALAKSLALESAGPKKLTSDSEGKVTNWIREHLELAVHPFAQRDPLADLEDRVLDTLDPPLNLGGRPTTQVRLELSRLRRVLSNAATPGS